MTKRKKTDRRPKYRNALCSHCQLVLFTLICWTRTNIFTHWKPQACIIRQRGQKTWLKGAEWQRTTWRLEKDEWVRMGASKYLYCYKCFGNNEECSLAEMHADIEKYTVRCHRSYKRCLTIIMEQDGRRLIEKRCANVQMCAKEIKRCDDSFRSRGGGRAEKLCEAECCEGYMCNRVARFPPVCYVIALGFLVFVIF